MRNRIPLSNQLVLISFITFLILTLSLTIFLPKALLPYFEETVYNYLNQPIKYFSNEVTDKYFNDNIIYIRVDSSGSYVISENAEKVLKTDNYSKILDLITLQKGSFKINNNKFYYVSNKTNDITKVAITNQKFVNSIKNRLFVSILPVIIITFLVILISLLIWCNFVVHKIGLLINKVKNINNDNYDHTPKIKVEDELQILEKTIDDARIMIKEQDNYKNEMYQNISHDFKTPISVIKSYIEANKDGIIADNEARKVIEEQIVKLEQKVKSLLQLNKLEYLKENYLDTESTINIVSLIEESVNKLKLDNKIKFKINTKKEEILVSGTIDMWESIIDNILTNFIRYAKNVIEITITQKKITFFNDGEAIDETIITDIFSPYKKGMKGQFGLGLSIVSKTCGYKIDVENVKKGVKFIIEKQSKITSNIK